MVSDKNIVMLDFKDMRIIPTQGYFWPHDNYYFNKLFKCGDDIRVYQGICILYHTLKNIVGQCVLTIPSIDSWLIDGQ